VSDEEIKPKRNNNGTFKRGQTANRKGINGQSGLQKQIKNIVSEDKLNEVITMLFDNCVSSAKVLLDRLLPIKKPVLSHVNLEELNAESVIEETAKGNIDPTTGTVLLNMIQTKQAILLNESFEDRINQLEAKLNEPVAVQ